MDFLLGAAIIVLPPQHQVPLALATAAIKVRPAPAAPQPGCSASSHRPCAVHRALPCTCLCLCLTYPCLNWPL